MIQKTGKIKFAKIENSPRLGRVFDYLGDQAWHSTRDIIEGAHVCAVNSCIAELRMNNFPVDCKRQGDIWYYRMGL